MQTRSARDFAREIIPDCVDETLFYLLHAVDEGLLRISFIASDGTVVDLTEEGQHEIAGWFGDGAWKKAHSKERVNDDLAHLDSYTGPDGSP